MAPLYRAAVHHPDREPDDQDDLDDSPGGSRAQRQRESLEAFGLTDLVTEVALLLAWTEHRAGKQVRLAEHVVGCLPRTLERLEAGRLDLALVTVVAEQSLDLDPQLALELDEEVFGPDGSGLGLNTAELKDVVDEVVARKDAAAVRRRSRRKVSARSVVMRPLGDGIAQLVMTGPAPAVVATYEHLDAVAGLNLAEARQAISEGRLPADGGDPYANGVDGLGGAPDGPEADAAVHDARRMPAHRFDALATAVQGASPAEPGAPRPQTTLELHAALSTLCGEDDQPGWLEGLGWVPGWLVRQGLTWERCRLRRVLTDPFTGYLVTVDGHTYPASWLTDPGPPPPPRTRPGPPPGTPPRGPGAAPTTFHGRPVQQVPGTPHEDDDDPPAQPDQQSDEHLDDLHDDVVLAPEADSPVPCTDGTCSPASPSSCPVASVGGGRYAPPAALARVVRRRWGRCAHPGCRRRATACDLDHVVPHRRGGPAAGGGSTCACNLEPKCRRHHLLKHGGRQDPSRPDDGWVRWTARWQQWRCDRGSSHWRSPLGFDHHSAPRPAALPDERYRFTPWPPRNPLEEERLGRRHAGALDEAPSLANARRTHVTFPDEPPF
nr:HNH endonuclease signature motif containing protein [Quadrisphaera sp. RL12-1S]